MGRLIAVAKCGRSSPTASDDRPTVTRPAARATARSAGEWRAVFILTTLYLLGTVDRQMAALLVTPIKQDMGLTDVQVSLIQGLAFALAYVLASVPIGWMVDRFSRKSILFAGSLVWGGAATLSGLSGSFGQLFLARAGVGAGEATLHPTSFSLIAQMFRPEKLGFPMMVFLFGGIIGSGGSYIVGAAIVDWAQSGATRWTILGELKGWQIAFIISGLPALLIGPLALLIREPARSTAALDSNASGYGDLWRFARGHRWFYFAHMFGFAMPMAFVVGLGAWAPAFYGRVHGWGIGQIGLWIGAGQILMATVGILAHGWLIDRWFGSGRHDAHMRYFAIMCSLAGPLGAAAFNVADPWLSLALWNAAYFCMMAYVGIGAASLQIATPSHLRGKASAVYLIVINVVGTVGGPLAVAVITDHVLGDEQALGQSMAIFALLSAGTGCALFASGLRPMCRIIGAQFPSGITKTQNDSSSQRA